MSTAKIVKRYANRKLYDTERSCYVTLDDIAAMIKVGDEVKVVDNKTGEDLTSVTLAQIIFEAEKKKSFMPLSLLRQLIQQGESAIEDARELVVGTVQAGAEELRSTAHKFRTGFARKPAERGGNGSSQARREGYGRRPVKISELVASSQQAFDELQHGVEERLKALGTVTRYAGVDKEMAEIRKRLDELEERLGSLPQ